MNNELLSEAADENALASLEKKLQVVRDLVTAVAKGFKTGLFLYGSGGILAAGQQDGKRLIIPQHFRNAAAIIFGHVKGKFNRPGVAPITWTSQTVGNMKTPKFINFS